ncbi:MAG: molecular chaperone HtpG, partial [Myxococcota bacterium]
PNASESEDSGSEENIAELLNRFSDILREHVSEVRISKRLTSSPTCLVMPQGGLPPYLERLMRLQNEQLPAQKRILEVNPNHPLIASLSKLYQQNPKDEALTNWVELVYDQALLAEGSPIESPAVFAERMTRLMTEAAQRHVDI